MKTEIKIHEPEVKEFPALYRGDCGIIVLISEVCDSVGAGIVIACEDRPDEIGNYYSTWDLRKLTKITSDVTITFKAGA